MVNPQLTKTPGRVQAIDVLRGAVIVLMAIDHVRVYSGVPAGGHDAPTFFTRWITHFCAPAFVFLAGTSAFLYGTRINDKGKLARFLLTRGLLLVILELTLIRLCWTFNLHFSAFTLAGVIWMLGWCMVLMAALIWLRPAIVGVLGILIIAFQDLFRHVSTLLPPGGKQFWEFIYFSGVENTTGISVLYVIVPWIGVMAAGYGFGLIVSMESKRRRNICLSIGIGSILVFLIIGSILTSQEKASPDAMPFLQRLLNQRKYPASQLYLLMTIGPLIALFPWADKAKGWFSEKLMVFGRVPMFYYICHILLIHLSALVVNLVRTGQPHQNWYGSAPFVWMEPSNWWGLPILYLVFAIDIVLLYFLCKWFGKYKFDHPQQGWLKFL